MSAERWQKAPVACVSNPVLGDLRRGRGSRGYFKVDASLQGSAFPR